MSVGRIRQKWACEDYTPLGSVVSPIASPSSRSRRSVATSMSTSCLTSIVYDECVEVAQHASSRTEVTSLGSESSRRAPPACLCPEYSPVESGVKAFDASSVYSELCDSDMPKVLNAETRAQFAEEISEILERDVGQGPCVFVMKNSNFCTASPGSLDGYLFPLAEDSASAFTPMELELAEERLESILETLVTPDDLLPDHLTASISGASQSTKEKEKKKRRQSFSESVTLDIMTVKEGATQKRVCGRTQPSTRTDLLEAS